MKANEMSLKELLSGQFQYQVPLYQRTYSWSEPQFKQLWSDICDLASDIATSRAGTDSHFLGSMVLAPSPSIAPGSVQQWLVVDGQQRLTTLSVMLAALRDHIAPEDPVAVDRINELYLVNKWAAGDLRYKLLPTQRDRPSFIALVDRLPSAGRDDGVGAAYRYFRSAMKKVDDPEDPYDLARIEQVITTALSLVVISAQQGDNVHRIFESLNNTGVRLTQADLLRNYFFMRMPTLAEEAHRTLWMPMQESLSSDEIELLVWLDLVLMGDTRAKRDELYRSQQLRLSALKTEEELEAALRELRRRSAHLRLILRPETEPNEAIRRALTRLLDWGSVTAYPVVMYLLDRRERGTTDDDGVARALGLLESYFVRRMIVGRTTSALARMFTELPAELDGAEEVDKALHQALSAPKRWWPNDASIRDAIRSDPFYWRGRANQRAFVLRRLEESYGSKEPVDLSKATIEHVLPQNPSDEWWADLAQGLDGDETAEELHQRLVHTLGNLTLTGYNSALSNRPFSEKRVFLSSSGIRMNQSIAKLDRWGTHEIHDRAEDLANRAIELWPSPIAVASAADESPRWVALALAMAALPTGSWTTYGDLAELIGSHAVNVGTRLANVPVPNAHRVLTAAGRVSPGFRWLEEGRGDDPIEMLKAEGVRFDASGQAHPAQRFSAADFADVLGLDRDEQVEEETPITDEAGAARFWAQLTEAQPQPAISAVRHLLDAWVSAGGMLAYGRGREASAILKMRPYGHRQYQVWVGAVYTGGTVSVWFQRLKSKEPFDQVDMREELRQRLNKAEGVSIAEAKIGVRPTFPLQVLTDSTAVIVDAMEWVAASILESTEIGR